MKMEIQFIKLIQAEEQVLDQYGNPIQEVEGGVAPPDIIGFTDPQLRAMEMLTGKYDADGKLMRTEGTGVADPYFWKKLKTCLILVLELFNKL